MKALFDNGNVLEVTFNKKENEYNYEVLDEFGNHIDGGYTEYRNIDMYYPMNEIDYILRYCEPYGCEGNYEIIIGGE